MSKNDLPIPERGESIDCAACGLHLPCSRWGHFYVTDKDGKRIALEGALESTIIAETLGIDEGAITGCVFAPRDYSASVELMAERVGYASFCICRQCLRQFSLDEKKDSLRCPSCKSEDVKTLVQLPGTPCPRCGKGTLAEKRTD